MVLLRTTHERDAEFAGHRVAGLGLLSRLNMRGIMVWHMLAMETWGRAGGGPHRRETTLK